MRIADDLTEADLKAFLPPDLVGDEVLRWKYQRFIKDYLRCVAALDENVTRLLDYLEADGIADDTIVVYTSDQGFFLSDHGWYDQRWMYEESRRMPMLVRYPREIPAGTTTGAMVLNVDFGPTFLDYAGVPIPGLMQGRSARSVLRGEPPADWRTSMYYRYWVHWDVAHHVWAHYGVRTATQARLRLRGAMRTGGGPRRAPHSGLGAVRPRGRPQGAAQRLRRPRLCQRRRRPEAGAQTAAGGARRHRVRAGG
jgi:arylsulfatase A-like enzyme